MKLKEKINPKDVAILVVDVQKDFADPEGFLAKRGRDMTIINKVMELLPGFLKKAELKNILTLYTKQIYDPEKLNNLQKEQYDIDGKFISCRKDQEGSDFFSVTPPPLKMSISNIIITLFLTQNLQKD